MEQALENARAAAGGSSGLAKAISEACGERISPQAVSQWKVTPTARVLAVERITGISRHELRPDIYGPAPAEAAQ
jgi:DNA-binding transcriptional regulator YdaS (Cro superfamily)